MALKAGTADKLVDALCVIARSGQNIVFIDVLTLFFLVCFVLFVFFSPKKKTRSYNPAQPNAAEYMQVAKCVVSETLLFY